MTDAGALLGSLYGIFGLCVIIIIFHVIYWVWVLIKRIKNKEKEDNEAGD